MRELDLNPRFSVDPLNGGAIVTLAYPRNDGGEAEYVLGITDRGMRVESVIVREIDGHGVYFWSFNAYDPPPRIPAYVFADAGDCYLADEVCHGR